MSFPTLIRTASENGLLRSGWDTWYEFRKARNLTSHVYDEERNSAAGHRAHAGFHRRGRILI